MADSPITPHATPRHDAQGRLTYVGEDGRRYVVGAPPPGHRPGGGEPEPEREAPGSGEGWE
jgi:hypothetical protein